MMLEIDEALESVVPDVVITPVGVGSLATAVTTHYSTAAKSSTAVVAVEPDTAACLWTSLERGEPVSLETTRTINQGMNCGTVSEIAWPILCAGVTASVTVSDWETHQDVLYLREQGVDAGPCGAAALAALRRLVAEQKATLMFNEQSVAVLLCTEGYWKYPIPADVSIFTVTELAQQLVRIPSVNPDLSGDPKDGERAIADYITAWFQHRGIETHWLEQTAGRPSVVAVARGTGGGKSIMLNGHIDTVSVGAYLDDPYCGKIQDGKLFGRGVQDMKAGVAGMMVATAAAAASSSLRGDVIFAGVADEENASVGTEEVLRAGWRTDAAIVPEPTDEVVLLGHKGFVWLDVHFTGVAAHGSRRDLGKDAIVHAGLFLSKLREYDARLNSSKGGKHPGLGQGSVHAGIISGGVETSSYPASCKLSIERRTIAGETDDIAEQEIRELLEQLKTECSDVAYELKTTFSRSPFLIDRENTFVASAVEAMERKVGKLEKGYGAFWTDAALLGDAGISTFIYGVKGA